MVLVDRYTIAHILVATFEIAMASLSVKTLTCDEEDAEMEM
jgi:hypothetical protein